MVAAPRAGGSTNIGRLDGETLPSPRPLPPSREREQNLTRRRRGGSRPSSRPLHLFPRYFANRARSASATAGCTNSLTSPPRLAISRISVDEMKLNCSVGVRNTVST